MCRLAPAMLLVTALTPSAAPAQTEHITEVLNQATIDPELALREVQRWTERRIVPMPEPVSVAEWEQYARQMRARVLDDVVFRGEATRWRRQPVTVEWLDTLPGGTGYSIRKLRYEVVPGMWAPALLYVPDNLSGRVPVIMNVNGHDRKDGKAADYKQMRCIHQARRGMIALNVEWLGMGQLHAPGFNHYCMNQLNLCGTSGLAPFYLIMSRGLDVLLQHPHSDATRVAVAGLSGGGWQTIFISALDTRVTLCNPVAGYSSYRTRLHYTSDLGDSEQTPCDLGSVTDYAQLTAMLAPRPALLTMNAEDDCCFRAEHALPPLLEAAQPIYALYGQPQNLRYHINHDPGTHNFGLENRQKLYGMLEHFFAKHATFEDPTEQASEEELYSKDELHVPLPDNNADFNSLALRISRDLRRDLPRDRSELSLWQRRHRSQLQEIVRMEELDTLGIELSRRVSEFGTTVRRWLRVGGDWTVPAVELSGPQTDPKKIAVLVADEGKASAAGRAEELLSAGYRVLAVDPFYFGESKISQRDYLFAILVSGVGGRPLGIQAGQIRSIARWARDEFQAEQVTVVAVGPRTALGALVAAASSEDEIQQVETFGCLGSLRELIEQNRGMNQVPESLCFGLLQQLDIAGLATLVLPRHIVFHDASERVEQDVLSVLERLQRNAEVSGR